MATGDTGNISPGGRRDFPGGRFDTLLFPLGVQILKGVLQNLMFCDTPFSAQNKSACKALHGKKIHCSKLVFEHCIGVLIVAASVARRREGVRGIFFPRGGTLWCKSNPFAVTKGGKG